MKILIQTIFVTFLFIFHSFSVLAASIATSHQMATEVAQEILKKGGNAVDATVAASFMLNVVQPYKMGIGGGGIMLIRTAKQSFVLDHREQAPLSAHEKMFIAGDGMPMKRDPDAITGPNPVGIPGTPAGLFEAHKKFGKLPWKSLVEPAIEVAKKGFPITQLFEEELQENWPRMRAFPVTVSCFSDGDGNYLKRGRTLIQPQLAATLQKIANQGADTFYTGELSKTWLAEAQKMGVKITAEDLKNYKVRNSTPVTYKVFNFNAVTSGPPSTGAILLAGAIRYLDHYYKFQSAKQNVNLKADSAKRIIVTAETLRYFQELRDANIADIGFNKIDPQKYLNSADEINAWTEIDKRIASRLDKIETAVTDNSKANFTQYAMNPIRKPQDEASHTAHLSVLDNQGLSVAYTTTIEAIFGSGIVVPNHGFLLNNELSDFDSEPGRPNSAAAGKRPRSNMSPTIFSELIPGKTEQPVAIVGAAGGTRIPTTIAEILENYYIHKMSAREAMAFPRFHPMKDSKLEIEKGYSAEVLKKLTLAGYKVEEIPTMWSVAQVILRRSSNDKWEAANESRYDGLAVTQ